ncbi:MAG: hypothetical protein QXN37_03605 [Candidatus Anstonellaceae archaeon]
MAEETLKMKIAKKAYVFEVKKRFEAKKFFAIKKKPETPAEDLKERLSRLFKKSPTAQQQSQQKGSPTPSLSSIILPTVGIVFLIFLGVFAFVLLPFLSQEPQATLPQQPSKFSGSLSFRLEDWMVLSTDVGEENSNSAYFLISYQASNLSSLNFSAVLYQSFPPTQVFILDYPKDSASSFPSFKKSLTEILAKHDIPVSQIGIEQVHLLGQGAILLVPTGYFPAELLGINNPYDFKSLLERGLTIIYIGMPFDTQALGRDGLTVSLSGKQLNFDRKARPRSTDGFRLFNAQYSVSAHHENKELAVLSPIYGSVSHVKYKEGSLLLIPQSLDGGWRERDIAGNWSDKGQVAAEDIARLIVEEPWVAKISQSFSTADLNSTRISLFSQNFRSTFAYAKIYATAVDVNGVSQKFFEVLKVKKGHRGILAPSEPKTIPFYLSGQKTRLNLALKENSTVPVKLYVEMYKDGQLLQRNDLEPGLTIPTTEKSVDIQVNAEPGNYVVLIVDDLGKVYAGCELEVADLDIQINSTNWEKGEFSFFLSSAGQPIEPRSLSISLNGKHEQFFTPSSLSVFPSYTAVEYNYPEKIESGTYTFTFKVGPYAKSITQSYSRIPAFWENPLFIFLTILAAVIAAIGTILRRPDEVRYGLDIPDFPPLSTIKIPIKRETVMEIFESVNNSYSWRWMPLKLEEIKNGFRKLTYQGKPILIGDFNLERILSKMEQEGLVRQEAGLWGLVKWENESNHTLHYLAIYRMLRNAFVNSAVKFSKLDSMPDCDVKAIAGNEELFIHIMQKPYEKTVHRALATAKKGTTILVFKTLEEKQEFKSSLNSTSKLAVAVKMEMESGRILLLSAKEEFLTFLKGLKI